MHEANLEHFVTGCCLDLYHNGSVMTNLNSNLAKNCLSLTWITTKMVKSDRTKVRVPHEGSKLLLLLLLLLQVRHKKSSECNRKLETEMLTGA